MHNSYEMDTKIEIKEEYPLSEEVSSQNDREFFTKNTGMKTNSNAVLLDSDCNMAIKMEIKSESTLPDLHLKKTEIDEQTLVPDFDSQKESEFLQEDCISKVKKYSSDNQIDNKVEIKEEYGWLKTGTLSVCVEIKNEDLPEVKLQRSYIEAVSGDRSEKSSLSCAEDLSKFVSLHTENDSAANGHSRNSKGQGSYVSEMYSKVRNIHSEQSNNYHDGEKTYCKASYLKQKNVIHEVSKSHKCEICNKRFNDSSNFRRHNLIHEGKKPHKCAICEKSFTQLSHLKTHSLIHEGKRPHKCEICEKRFTQFSDLKKHNLIHESKKPYKCSICEKQFTQVSNLKVHQVLHEDKKPHKCEICEKRFRQLSSLKMHTLIHEGKQPHRCETCEKRFTQLSHLKRHNLIHERKKLQKC